MSDTDPAGPQTSAPAQGKEGRPTARKAKTPGGWDKNQTTTTFTVAMDPKSAAACARTCLQESGWAISMIDSSFDIFKTPTTTGDQLTRAARVNPRSKALVVGARRGMSRAAQLQPRTDEARRMLNTWSLQDRYPLGIARGGCLLVNFDFVVTVRIQPPKERSSSPAGAGEPAANAGAGSGTAPTVPAQISQVEVTCQEVISPFKGKFPDPSRFLIVSEMEATDPTASLKKALTAPAAPAAHAPEEDEPVEEDEPTA